jgi:hypothetical protein
MHFYVSVILALLIVDVLHKLWRLYSGDMHYKRGPMAGDAAITIGMIAWGMYVLAKAPVP